MFRVLFEVGVEKIEMLKEKMKKNKKKEGGGNSRKVWPWIQVK